MSGLNFNKGMMSSSRLAKPKSLVARLPIPNMDKEKAKQFQIMSTLNLSDRSPLITKEVNNNFARMPTIFAKNKGSEQQ